MSKIKTKELIICVVTLAILILSIVTDVFASDIMSLGNNSAGNNNNNITEIIDRGNNTIGNNTAGNNTAGNNTIGNNTAGNNTTGNNVTTNKVANKTTMPDTGVDYSILLIVAVCGISAIYAYKKISDYKNF